MITFNLNGVDYTIRWKHTYPNLPRTINIPNLDGRMIFYPNKPHHGYTECHINRKNDNLEIIGYGITHCSRDDDFSKIKGCKESIKKALSNGFFMKSERTIIWSKIKVKLNINDRREEKGVSRDNI